MTLDETLAKILKDHRYTTFPPDIAIKKIKQAIREILPELREITYAKGTDYPLNMSDAAWNGAIKEVLRRLDDNCN